jgi:hypothetical protein
VRINDKHDHAVGLEYLRKRRTNGPPARGGLSYWAAVDARAAAGLPLMDDDEVESAAWEWASRVDYSDPKCYHKEELLRAYKCGIPPCPYRSLDRSFLPQRQAELHEESYMQQLLKNKLDCEKARADAIWKAEYEQELKNERSSRYYWSKRFVISERRKQRRIDEKRT